MPVGVILATYGEPAVNSFAEQWMYSYRILKGLTRKIAAIPGPLLPVIATARARGRVKLWKKHAFTSPLEKLHRDTVGAVRVELSRRGHDGATVVIPAYEFRKPGLTEALRQLDQSGCERAIVVPMYVAEGDFTHGMTRFAIDQALTEVPSWRGRLTMASLTETTQGARVMGGALSGWLFDSLLARGLTALGQEWAVMLAAHGTVLHPPAGVDNGLEHFLAVLGHVEAAVRPHVGRVAVGWLNHTKGGEWTRPAMPDALAELRSRGFKKLVYFPWGFTTDNAETVLEGRVMLAEMADPFERVEHLACMNSYPGFVCVLTDCIEQAAGLAPEDSGRGMMVGRPIENGLHTRSGAARIRA